MGVLLREKQLIDQCHAFGICAAYDEILRFKASAASAASAASQQTELTGLFNSDVGLVQALADNYDANISSANGLRSTHALALLLTQVNENENKVPTSPDTIKRLSKDEMKDSISHPVVVHRYHGPKKPDMPPEKCCRVIPPLKVLASQTISLTQAHDIDYQFLHDIVVKPKTPEYNGFNTNLAREQGHSVKPATTAIYTPLIDIVPSDPDTIMTAMVEAQRITQECGQSITVFTNDQQLYRVAVNVTWVYPELFADFVPRLGGMHFLMSYIGAVGTLMANTGLSELMQTAFGGVPKMLTGKKFPQNMRALRLVAEELLRPVITATENYDELIALLDNKSHESRTAKLWVGNLIKPVLLMMMFVRAEREADWVLHLSVAAQMLPYFFASGHCNYARYGSYYLRSMEHLPAELLSEFLKGNHVMRHSAGIWNAIWSDMYIETTFMRYGHEAGGLTGLTLKPSALARWALSLHACSQLRGDLVAMKNDTVDKVVTTHKEESTARIVNDSTDREKIHNALTNYIDPLATDVHHTGLINIVTGHHTTDKVNVDQSVSIGKQQMAEFESQWPGSFNKNISKKVTTMASTKKNIKLDETPVYETELIYTRVICLQQYRDIDIKDVLTYELSPVPASIFDDNGNMRVQTKSILKSKLQVEQSSRTKGQPDAIIIDGCALLWTVHWPSNGCVNDYVINFSRTINFHLSHCDVYLIFDRYSDDSTKHMTRSSRSGTDASRKHQLTLQTTLPAQKVILAVTYNKVQLIDLISDYLIKHVAGNENRLVITGKDPTPIQLWNDTMVLRNDMKTSHEEADVIIVQQLAHLAAGVSDKTHVKVVCDDTDVFVLLLHLYTQEDMSLEVTMESPIAGRTVIDIRQTARTHRHILKYLPAVHALTGCDTVSYMYGIGKNTALNVLTAGQHLTLLGQHNADASAIVAEATDFIAACYGSKVSEGDMSTHRYAMWKAKMANPKITAAPKLKTLPPSNEAFVAHVNRAHYQTMIWMSATQPDPPVLDPTDYGWTKAENGVTLSPTTLPTGVSPVPINILRMIKCGCSTARPCATGRCGCVAAQMSCSMFCSCHADSDCFNEQTRVVASNSDDEDNE